MSRSVYSTGDAVVLKSGTFRQPGLERLCFIKAVLPEQRGTIQYRVQFGDETFERRIDADDIERTVAAPEPERAMPLQGISTRAARETQASPWIKPVAVKGRR